MKVACNRGVEALRIHPREERIEMSEVFVSSEEEHEDDETDE